jgi:hypothetical protein
MSNWWNPSEIMAEKCIFSAVIMSAVISSGYDQLLSIDDVVYNDNNYEYLYAGAQLNNYTGVAAVLRFPLPDVAEFDHDDDDSDSEDSEFHPEQPGNETITSDDLVDFV